MSDAFHLLSDVASFIVALAAIYLAEKPPTKSKKKKKAFHLFFILSTNQPYFIRAYIWIPSS